VLGTKKGHISVGHALGAPERQLYVGFCYPVCCISTGFWGSNGWF